MGEEVVTITSTSHGIKEEGGSLLRKMFTTSDCFDVTLVTGDGQQVFAHKAVLSTCSPLLASVIGRAGPACGSGGQVIYLHAAETEVVRRLVEYCYLGRVSLQASQLDSFLKLGESLQLCELKGNTGPNDQSAEHRQPKQTNNIDNDIDNGQNEEEQINVVALNAEQQKKTIKEESAMCETGFATSGLKLVTSGLKEDSSQFQENNKIPSFKDSMNISSKTL